ncbi:TetR/AcrR family transcriptional regulator [Thalassomonas actiniarum]|uniref:TetR family transcriptional regulator C-terminal domain-containing protein n=1 Tax=Thalassomonas actiniarum TaxID=485447 RepID=A0AAF0C5V6_9GAMM|nr:TetR/AcrR family transcriptional regulator [Thalassomonas actiniarum]WDE01364.1 TetR family transcriptional regulator C-terminal domain-containing protein [Thalassomonas actiniarum]
MSSAKSQDGNIRQKNKALILTAAKKEFVTYGFKGASIKRIAERANIPRTNIHYYYKNKIDLYQQLLNDILETWNQRFDTLTAEDNAKEALTAYIRAKVMYSKTDPDASRIFASEIIHGAPHLKPYLAKEFKEWVQGKTAVIQSWIDQGQINAVNPYHLLFLIWGASQHYADFNVQVLSAMDKQEMSNDDYEDVVTSLTSIILCGCGIK